MCCRSLDTDSWCATTEIYSGTTTTKLCSNSTISRGHSREVFMIPRPDVDEDNEELEDIFADAQSMNKETKDD